LLGGDGQLSGDGEMIWTDVDIAAVETGLL
jgi:hypothetical protein